MPRKKVTHASDHEAAKSQPVGLPCPLQVLSRDKHGFVVRMTSREFMEIPDHPDWDGGPVVFEDRGPLTPEIEEFARHVAAVYVEHAGIEGGRALYKFDGHRRAHFWQGGVLPRPDTVVVRIIEVEDLSKLGGPGRPHPL